MLHLDMFVVLMLLGVYNRCWGINKKTILQIPSSLYPTSHVKITNTIIIVPNITRQDYKYHHHCTQHHTSRLQIPSSLYPTSHVKITNTIIIVPNITRQDYKYHHHCTQHHTSRLQIPSSLYPTSHVKITNTIIIVSNITRQDYKFRQKHNHRTFIRYIVKQLDSLYTHLIICSI